MKHRFFNSVQDIERKRDSLETSYATKWHMLDKIVRLHNGLSQHDERIRENDDNNEITNYRVSHEQLSKHTSIYSAMINQTNQIADIKFNTGDAFNDARTSSIVTKIFNKHIFHYGTEFSNFVEEFGHEELVSGVTVTIKEGCELFPRVERRLIFPAETRMDGKDLTYWFRQVDLSIRQLIEYQKQSSDKKGDKVNKEVIRGLLSEINDKIEKSASDSTSITRYDYSTEWGYLNPDTTVKAFWYYEVQEDKSVNKTLITEENTSDVESCVEVMHVTNAEKRVEDMIKFSPVNTIIGGSRNIGDAVGIMELIYNPTAEINEVMNALLDAALFDLKQKWINDGMSEDEISAIDFNTETVFDARLKLSNERQNSNAALGMTQMLMQQNHQITNSVHSNIAADGQLASQAKQQYAQQGNIMQALTAKRYRNLDRVIEFIVYNALSKKPTSSDKHKSDYEGRKAVHDDLSMYGIDIEPLIERIGGRLRYMTVRMNRVLSPADRDTLIVQREHIAEMLRYYSPEARKIALYRMDAAILDPDVADALHGYDEQIEKITSDQDFIAMMENSMILNYSIAGIPLSTRRTDVDYIHIEKVLEGIQIEMAKNQIKPWGRKNIVHIGGFVEHGNAHLQNLAEAGFDEEYNMYLQKMQELINLAKPLVAEVQAREEQEQGQQGEMTDAQMKMAELEIKAKKVLNETEKVQIARENLDRLKESQAMNDQLKQRRQLTGEIFQSANIKNQREAMRKR